MALSNAEKVAASHARRKARGEALIKVWVPDPEKYGPEDAQKVRDLAAELCAARIKADKKEAR